MSTSKIFCVPGDRLCASNDNNIPGNGTYTRFGYIYSSLAGYVNVIEDGQQKTIEVIHKEENAKRVPTTGSIVTCKVQSINLQYCKVTIHCVEDYELKQPFRGILRKEDIRATDKDRVEVYKCYRPGDVILARVIGLCDGGHLLSTAENELGVVAALSEADVTMVPVSWTEMICPKTYNKEQRKVAKVLPADTSKA